MDLFETPWETYNAYQRFLRREDYKRAYRCLEKLLHQFPDDIELLQEIVGLCLFSWKRPEMGRRHLVKLINLRSSWIDYVSLSSVEAHLENIDRARQYLAKARELQKAERGSIKSKKEIEMIFSEIEAIIEHKERSASLSREIQKSQEGVKTKTSEIPRSSTSEPKRQKATEAKEEAQTT